MRTMRVLRVLGYGASLALLLALSPLGVPNNAGGGDLAFAQGTGQPGTGQPDSGDQGPGQTPNQAPGTSTEATSGAGDQRGTLLPVPGGAVIVVGGPRAGGRDEGIEEGDDIDEGLSNQRFDPDDN